MDLDHKTRHHSRVMKHKTNARSWGIKSHQRKTGQAMAKNFNGGIKKKKNKVLQEIKEIMIIIGAILLDI